MSLVQEFRAFIMRGNIIDLAVAFILGVAFTAVVTAFTDGVIMAFIAAIVGEPSFHSITIGLGDGVIRIGSFITALVNFLLIAAVLFFILKAVARAQSGFDRGAQSPEDDSPAPTDEAVLLAEIRDLLRSGSRP
jgi:large conductance mechanosensitive channel